MAKLTVKYIEEIERRARRGEAVKEWHPDGDGLYLRVRKSGHMSFAGRRRPFAPLPLGPLAIGLPHARALWREALVKMARGIDPSADRKAAKAAARAKESGDGAVGAALDLYVKRRLADIRSGDARAKVLRKETAKWRDRELASIGPEDVHALIDDVIDRGARGQARHLASYLDTFFSWCVNRRLVSENPCAGLTKPPIGKPRDRVLDDRELALVWRAADRMGWPFGPVIQLLILSGQRKSEIAEGRWDEIDLLRTLWRLPPDRVKNSRPHDVPLSPQAIRIVEALPRIASDAGIVFSTNGRTPVSGFSRAKRNLDAIVTELNDGTPIAPWVIHDLRRSCASGMARLGVDLHVVERALNHISGSFGGIVGVYQRHGYADEMRAALDAWARHVERVVSGEAEGNVVEMRARG